MTTATSAVDRIREARSALDEAEKTLKTEAQGAVNDALKEVFADESVNEVRWAQKSSEYNDEGMYEGVFGPVVNWDDEGKDEWERDYDWLYGYNRTPSAEDRKADALKTVLELVGEKVLSDLYGDEAVVKVTRADGGLIVDTEYKGY